MDIWHICNFLSMSVKLSMSTELNLTLIEQHITFKTVTKIAKIKQLTEKGNDFCNECKNGILFRE